MPPIDSSTLLSHIYFDLSIHSLVPRDAIDNGSPNPRGKNLADLAITFACLSFFFVSSRIATRIFMLKLGTDDYLIILSQLMALAMAVTFSMEAKYGFGLHTSACPLKSINQVSKEHRIAALKYFFAAQILYKVATCFTKMSICFFYLRIFPSKNFKIATFVTMAIVIAYSIGAVCSTIWSCDPIAKSWDRGLPGKCLQIGDVWYSTSVMAIVTDLIIIILPIYQIRRLQLPMSQKFGLTLMFSLGFFVIACTVVRMATVGPAVAAKDTMFYQATSNSWTFLEVNVSIICASLPVLKAPIIKFCPWFMRQKTSTSAYGVDFSKDNYGTKNVLPSQNSGMGESLRIGKSAQDRDSDEEFILEEMGSKAGVMRTTEINVSYEARSLKGPLRP